MVCSIFTGDQEDTGEDVWTNKPVALPLDNSSRNSNGKLPRLLHILWQSAKVHRGHWTTLNFNLKSS